MFVAKSSRELMGMIALSSFIILILLETTAIGIAAKSLPLIIIITTAILIDLISCVLFSDDAIGRFR
jgi:hypothetical protein